MNKFFLLSTFFLALMLSCCSSPADSISGIVLDEDGKPLPGAVVRIKATEKETLTDLQGYFTLTDLTSDQPVFVTAWDSGYFINGVEDVLPGEKNVEIHLHAHHDNDNPDYDWLPSTYSSGLGEDQGCAECHSSQSSELDFSLPVDEWLLDAHSQSAVNPRFISMYLGQDIAGQQSPETRYSQGRDYGRFPLRPDPDQPYYGPGYKLNFPETDGNCAACHTPLASVDDPYSINPTQLSGVHKEGISCDFCHKVWDVILDPGTGFPYPNMPGVLSLEFRRPPDGHQFFAGPLDDVAPGEDTYSPIQRKSQYCASCHFGVFWDTTVYNSFGEWLESPYSDPETGKTCQDCHMPTLGVTHFALIEQGGVTRDPDTIFSHRMPGAADEELLQNALSMQVAADRGDDTIMISVSLTNDQTGHHIPTDSPLRNMILLVEAKDSAGEMLELSQGPLVPDWGGEGNPVDGYYAGLPGKGYAKILMEMWTEVSPTGAYWNPTQIISDNRLAAFETDESTYIFDTPSDEEITIKVTLLFRRAFIELMDQKQWDTPDIIMEEEILLLP
ncbi:MAG: carboxypeptidase regulatory-like domain-containing protein [Anaerolineaceae bacterium]|nr:carboxypeptidase regulatory-like domain-containing protein [Anaerolineaceae bacterium]